MERSVAHLDMDSFFVSCERLENSQLNNIPLIIGGGSDRSVVASCSYEARQFGVRAAMPIKMALHLCPQAKIVRGDMEKYSEYSHIVTEIIKEESPLMEKASIDEFYIDETGMDKFFGCYKWTVKLAERVKRETGLPISFGLSINKTVSKIATGEAKPIGKIEVKSNQVQLFLNPLSIKKIPMIGDKTYDTLARVGIRQIKTLAETPVELIQELVDNGLEIWKRSNGIDNSPVEPYKEKKSVSTERTFETDTMDVVMIKNLLMGMIEKLAFELRQNEWLTACVAVKIRYNNFDTYTKQTKVPYTSCDHLLKAPVFALFDTLYDRRMRIRLIGLRFSHLVRGSYQINLFDDTSENMALYQAIDKMKNRFGFNAVMKAVAIDKK